MKKLTNKQSQILADVKASIELDIHTLEGFIEQGRHEMVSHVQDGIKERLSGIASYLIFSDSTANNRNWNAIKEDFWAITYMDVLNVRVWLDLIDSDKAVSEEEWKEINNLTNGIRVAK